MQKSPSTKMVVEKRNGMVGKQYQTLEDETIYKWRRRNEHMEKYNIYITNLVH